MRINRKGFTLTELVVTFLISAILMVVLGTMLITVTGAYNRRTALNERQMIAEGIFDSISETLKYAGSVQLLNGTNAAAAKYANTYKFTDGMVYSNDEKIFGALLDYSNKIRVTADNNGAVLSLKIDLLDRNSDELIYTTENQIRVNLLAYNGGSIENDYGGEITDPVISYTIPALTVNDGINSLGANVYWDMYNMPAFYNGLSDSERKTIGQQLTGSSLNTRWNSNTYFRKYLTSVKYGGQWPTVLKSELGIFDSNSWSTPYRGIETLYVCAYIDSPGKTSENVCAYITSSPDGYYTYMIYNPEDNSWYYTDNTLGRIYVKQSWFAIKMQMLLFGYEKYTG